MPTQEIADHVAAVANRALDAADIEGIIIGKAGFELGDGKIADATTRQADEEGGGDGDEAGGGGDGGQAGDHAGGGAEDAGLAFVQPFDQGPAQGTGRGGEMGGGKGAAGEAAGGEGAAGIEAKPAHPEEAGADEGEHDVMRHHGFMPVAFASTQEDGTDQGGDARTDVDHGAPGEIKHRNLAAERPVEITALAPDHVAQRKIYHRDPQQDEQDVALEFDAFGHRATDEGGSDDGEHHLEPHEGLLGHGWERRRRHRA